jgi:creatinine amidohydrolase
MDYAQNFVSASVALAETGGILTPEGGVGFGWMAEDLHPSGTTGNAAAADAERGKIETERAAEALIRLIEEVQAYQPPFLR